MKEQVLVLLYPGCITFEVALAAELLSEKFQIVTASPDGENLPETNGLPVTVQLKYADVDLSLCKAILVPGGNPKSISENKEIDRILVEANKMNLLIAGICAGPSILAKAGILKGKKIAHGYGPKQLEFLKPIFEDVNLTDQLYVIDGNFITAKPEAHIDFAVEIACKLNVVDASKSGRLKEYHRGTLGRKIRPLALALIQNEKGQLLLHKAIDRVKNETFYRPLGGGIEFFESGKTAVEREIEEELNLKSRSEELLTVFENIYLYEGCAGHEIVMLFPVIFEDPTAYNRVEFDIIESGKVINKAIWRSVAEIEAEGAQLYPNGLKEALVRFNLKRE